MKIQTKLWTTRIALAVLLLVSLNSAKSNADDTLAKPPKKMEGGVAVKIIDPAAMQDPPAGVEAIKLGDEAGLKIVAEKEQTVEIAAIDKPDIKSKRYMLKGWIRYNAVEGDGYMEMWSHFADGGVFFSRTMGEQGPMKKITGDSDWRVFILPFTAEEGMKLDRLVVNLCLAGKGTVYLTELRLVDLDDKPKQGNTDKGGAWWTPRTSGWIGGGIGMLGALLGILSAYLAKRSTQGSIVLAKISMSIGGLSLIAAAIAFVLAQPWHVWYPPALLGLILLFVFGFRLPAIRRESVASELRRMRAVDA